MPVIRAVKKHFDVQYLSDSYKRLSCSGYMNAELIWLMIYGDLEYDEKVAEGSSKYDVPVTSHAQ